MPEIANSIPIDEHPMIVGPVYAIRGWQAPFGQQLVSMGVQYTWTNPPERARCLGRERKHNQFDAPRITCVCGYYAHKPGMELEMLQGYKCDVVGVVELQGHVVEHQTGYRAQLAIPRFLVTVPDSWGMVMTSAIAGYERIQSVRPATHVMQGVGMCREWIFQQQQRNQLLGEV